MYARTGLALLVGARRRPALVAMGPDRLLVRPRGRAMAEIDQPCSRHAVPSISSFPVNMKEVPIPADPGLGAKSLGRGAASTVDGHSTRSLSGEFQ